MRREVECPSCRMITSWGMFWTHWLAMHPTEPMPDKKPEPIQ